MLIFKKVEGTNKLESEIQSLFKKIPYERDGYVIPKDLFDSKYYFIEDYHLNHQFRTRTN